MSEYQQCEVRIFCANPGCEKRSMKVHKMGVDVIETAHGGNTAYKRYASDVLICPNCGNMVARTGKMYEYHPEVQSLPKDVLIVTEHVGEEDVFRKKFENHLPETCSVCGGDGFQESGIRGRRPCVACDGSGVL